MPVRSRRRTPGRLSCLMTRRFARPPFNSLPGDWHSLFRGVIAVSPVLTVIGYVLR